MSREIVSRSDSGRYRVVTVVGARPNFMKAAPIERALFSRPAVEHLLVHTGQHYDQAMSSVFFEELGLREPARHLGVGSGRHGEMTGKIMIAFEQACLELEPDLVVVVGDVNSTVAAALVARKLFVPVAHVEAGLRSFDESMPEEHNRRLTDHLSNLLFASEPSAVTNLNREGIDSDRVHLVGDIMLETLQGFLPRIRERRRWEELGLAKGCYSLATIHRPSNVDDPRSLEETVRLLRLVPGPTVFPVHPRTVASLEKFGLTGLLHDIPGMVTLAPEPYLEFVSLLEGARVVITDSGSIQAEASLFDVPCLVCRENTERPIYVEQGTTELVGRDVEKFREAFEKMASGQFKKSAPMVSTLGLHVAEKIAEIMVDYLTAGHKSSL
ncbi:MAG: UDP-N-acetylglucosamine 2-epimerase (non-hydrolyzing) [Thermodesulfobacteriota bacterium]